VPAPPTLTANICVPSLHGDPERTFMEDTGILFWY
jgi:hypothetical protein